MIIISISVAISQLEVKTDLLNHVIVIVLITVGLAVALAMGLGSREIAGQILAGIYVRELYRWAPSACWRGRRADRRDRHG